MFAKNPLSMEWDHKRGTFVLYESATGRYDGTKRKYRIMDIKPYEQHRGTIKILRLSDITQPWAKQEMYKCQREREAIRRARNKRMSEWLTAGMKDIVSAHNIASTHGSRKSSEKSWAEGMMRESLATDP